MNRVAEIAGPSTASAAGPADAVPDSRGLNFYRADPDLAPLIRHYLPDDLARTLVPQLDRLGALVGDRLDRLAHAADRHEPELHPRTRAGQDLDSIEKHPAYEEMERIAFGELGLAAMSHRPGVFDWPDPLPPVAKYLVTYLFAQGEFGLLCPVSMTDSLTRTLRKFGDPALVERYLPGLVSQDMDALLQGAMFMTEQGAGSDVGATSVHAEPAADGSWRLTGEKWFCSNADADLAMVLARPAGAPEGLKGVSLFLLPRHLPDDSRNAFRIVRLKDKLGTRSMASGEISLAGATAWMVGAPGDGFRQMADMINNSRLSNGVRSAGMMRRAATEALFIAHNRRAFGRRLIEMPLMRRQLAKILVPAEQARTCMFLTAEALRRSDAGENGGEAAAYPLLRILTPLIKFRACRDARRVTGDAMEVRGGCGYIEEFPDARLLRDSHLGSIWEGTSNIVALDVMRAGRRENAFAALRALVDRLAGVSSEIAELPGLADRAFALAAKAAGDPAPQLARQAATALYNVTSAAGLLDEARQLRSPRRLALARLVVRHRLMPADPLASDLADPDLAEAVLYDPAAAA